MNTQQCVALLRHVIYLLLIIQFGAGFTHMMVAEQCMAQYRKYEIVPINVQEFKDECAIAVDLLFTMSEAFEIIRIILSVVHFCAIMFRDQCEQLNFVCGAVQLLIGFMQFTCAQCISNLQQSFDFIIEYAMTYLFATSNSFNESHPEAEKYLNKSAKFKNYQKLFLAPFELGWSIVASGSQLDHENIDYTQINLQCCGLNGRGYWEMYIPRSCCEEDYGGYKCTLAVAFSKSCLYDYHQFLQSALTAKSDIIGFGIVTLTIGLIAMYFTYVKMLNPDDDFKSDRSSDDEEEVY